MSIVKCDNLEVLHSRCYGGESVPKIAVRYSGDVWMLKFTEPEFAVSEYIGSQIYKMLGIPVHDTQLGSYGGKICVMCKDIAYPNNVVEFRAIRSSVLGDDITQGMDGMSNYLSDVLQIISACPAIDTSMATFRFWIMFVVDALIGKTNRSNSDWGFLVHEDKLELAPVYSCRVSYATDSTCCSYKDDAGNFIEPFSYIESNPSDSLLFALLLVDDKIVGRVQALLDSISDVMPQEQSDNFMMRFRENVNHLLSISDYLMPKPKPEPEVEPEPEPQAELEFSHVYEDVSIALQPIGNSVKLHIQRAGNDVGILSVPAYGDNVSYECENIGSGTKSDGTHCISMAVIASRVSGESFDMDPAFNLSFYVGADNSLTEYSSEDWSTSETVSYYVYNEADEDFRLWRPKFKII